MANEQKKENRGIRIALIRKLTIAEESRNEPSKGAYPGGRIKRFFGIFKANYSNMTMMNALNIVFLLPTIAVVLAFMVIGIEDFAYMLENMTKPYLLANFGIGLSSGVSLTDAKLAILLAYRIEFLAIFLTLPTLSFGIAGTLHVSSKLVWGESFITKKDKFGNNIPRLGKEYFIGVKKYWFEVLIYVTVLSVILCGGVNMIITFIEALYKGTANAGHYIGLILSCIIMLFSLLVFINLLPTAVTYRTKYREKLKNATIFTLALPVPNLIILLFFAVPFVLMLLGSLFVVIAIIFMITFGISFYLLMFTNYADYNSEQIIIPIYELQKQEAMGIKKTKNKNKDNKGNKGNKNNGHSR